ncbi:GNAT family N-acetyltransferase [Nakamurella sp. GG22]
MLAAPLSTARLELEPLRVDHADEMSVVLGDPALYAFTGGEPPGIDELRQRYARQVTGRSADGGECWLNWILRHDGRAVGYVQATVTAEEGWTTADVAWVVATGAQGSGFAGEAAAAMIEWLRVKGADVITAHVHPEHAASAAVARRVGLAPTPHIVDGEVRWILKR